MCHRHSCLSCRECSRDRCHSEAAPEDSALGGKQYYILPTLRKSAWRYWKKGKSRHVVFLTLSYKYAVGSTKACLSVLLEALRSALRLDCLPRMVDTMSKCFYYSSLQDDTRLWNLQEDFRQTNGQVILISKPIKHGQWARVIVRLCLIFLLSWLCTTTASTLFVKLHRFTRVLDSISQYSKDSTVCAESSVPLT